MNFAPKGIMAARITGHPWTLAELVEECGERVVVPIIPAKKSAPNKQVARQWLPPDVQLVRIQVSIEPMARWPA